MHVSSPDDFSGLANAWKYCRADGSDEFVFRIGVFIKNHD